MTAVPEVMLPHRVALEPIDPDHFTATGAAYLDLRTDVHALVTEKAGLRLDERTDSDTAGTVIVCNTQILVNLADAVEPGSRTTWRGRELSIANVERYDHPRAPQSAVLWGV